MSHTDLATLLRDLAEKASLDMDTVLTDSHYMSHNCPVADLVAIARDAAFAIEECEREQQLHDEDHHAKNTYSELLDRAEAERDEAITARNYVGSILHQHDAMAELHSRERDEARAERDALRKALRRGLEVIYERPENNEHIVEWAKDAWLLAQGPSRTIEMPSGAGLSQRRREG